MSIHILNPARTVIALQGRHCKWLIDGQSFLDHVADLSAIKLVARCRCDVGADVVVTRLPDHPGKYDAHCRSCGAGTLYTIAEGKPDDLEPLLKTLRWELCCTDCGEPVEGANTQTASRFTVTCSCTTREYCVAVA